MIITSKYVRPEYIGNLKVNNTEWTKLAVSIEVLF